MMAELGIDAGLPQRILHVLTANQHRDGLTTAEIRQALGLDERYNRKINPKIYKAIGVLMGRGQIVRRTSPDDKRLGIYSLPKPKEALVDSLDGSDDLSDLDGSESQEFPPELPIECLAVIEDSATAIVHSPPRELNLLEDKVDSFDGWNITPSPQLFPSESGLYAFFSGISGKCLYIGRTIDLLSRCRCHPRWREIVDGQECPYAAYKIIDCGQLDETKQALAYEEGLMIGMLRPELNAASPLSERDVALNNYRFGQIELAHWTQFVSKRHQPYHPLMLTDKGYVVLKRIEPEKQWLRVLYDRDYAHKMADDLAGQVDTFFTLWELRDQDYEPVKSSRTPTIEIVVNDSFKVRISISQK